MKKKRTDLSGILSTYQNSANVFDFLVNESTDGIIIFDAEGSIRFANRTFSNITGHLAENLLSTNMFDLLCLESISILKSCMTNGSSAEKYEKLTILRKDGSKVPCEFRIKSTGEMNDDAVCFIAEFRIRLENYQTAGTVVHNDFRNSALLSGADIMYQVDKNSRIVFINDAVKVLGYAPEELLGTNIFDIIHPDDRVKAQYHVNERRTGLRSTMNFELRFIGKMFDPDKMKDGEVGYNNHVYVNILNAFGQYSTDIPDSDNFIGTFGIARDITERKKIQDDLERSEEKFRLLSEQSLLGIVIIQDDRLKYVNDAASSLFEFPTEQILEWTRRDIHKYIHKDDRKLILEQAAKKQSGCQDTVTNYIFRYLKPGGGYKTLEIFSKSVEYEGRFADMVMMKDVTGQKKAEDSLRFTQFTVDNAGHAAFWMNTDAEIIYVNRAACGLLGYTMIELLGMHMTDIDKGALKEEIRRGWKHVRSEKVCTFESGFRISSGTVITVEISINHVEFDGKEYFCAFANDVTERKQMEDSLKISENKYRQLTENLPVALYEIDADGMLTYVNKYALQLFGYSRSDFEKGLYVDDVISDDERKKFLNKLKEIFSDPNERITEGEYIFNKKNREIFPARINAQAIFKNGRIHGIRGYITDISEMKRSESILKCMLEISRASSLSSDLESYYENVSNILGRVIDSTNFFVALYNSEEDTLEFVYSTLDCYEISVMENVMLSKSLSAELIRQKSPILITKDEFEKRREKDEFKDWGPPAEIWMGVPLMINDEVIGVMCVQDFEDRSKYSPYDLALLEAASEIVATAIKQKWQEVESKNLEKQFYQVQKLESIGRLAGGVAHDFNNILTGIMGFAELLYAKFPDNETVEGRAADIILKGAERASVLTKQLLGFARAGKYEQKPVRINRIISEAIRVTEKIFDKRIQVELSLSTDIKSIIADMNQLDQIFTNIFINAKDAMPDGGKLAIKTRNIVIRENDSVRFPGIKPGMYVQTTIEDTGIGMDSDVLEHIFEPFYTTKSSEKGTGLGLASVYGIVKNHNGFIYCESSPGIGTTFLIFFPCTEENEYHEAKSVSEQCQKASILVVDDESDILTLSRLRLEELGCSVMTASSGEEAYERYKQHKDEIDLVILDVVMPGMSGIDTLKVLREINKDLAIIMSSGYSKDKHFPNILNEGADAFIQKPYNKDELIKAINSSLSLETRTAC